MDRAEPVVRAGLDALRQRHLEMLAVRQPAAVVVGLRAVEIGLLLLVLGARVAGRRIAGREEAWLTRGLHGVARALREHLGDLRQFWRLARRVRIGLRQALINE